jgi:peptidoglycan lytic transglycosylase
VFSFFILVLVLLLSGCSHQKTAKVNVPPPPAIQSEPVPEAKTKPKQSAQPEAEQEDVIGVPGNAKPIFTETGLASWYGPPYHNRRSSNGEIYNMNALTAAHRTVPLGSICRVTNVKTGSSTLVRITDRGPFIKGRVVDLSLAAAKKIGVWKAGVARVKLEVLTSPASLAEGGRWAVQIGGFDDSKVAADLVDHLTRRYHTAQVMKFASPTGAWWIRVRVRDDDKGRAEELARATTTPEGAVFLVRLD